MTVANDSLATLTGPDDWIEVTWLAAFIESFEVVTDPMAAVNESMTAAIDSFEVSEVRSGFSKNQTGSPPGQEHEKAKALFAKCADRAIPWVKRKKF